MKFNHLNPEPFKYTYIDSYLQGTLNNTAQCWVQTQNMLYRKLQNLIVYLKSDITTDALWGWEIFNGIVIQILPKKGQI